MLKGWFDKVKAVKIVEEFISTEIESRRWWGMYLLQIIVEDRDLLYGLYRSLQLYWDKFA